MRAGTRSSASALALLVGSAGAASAQPSDGPLTEDWDARERLAERGVTIDATYTLEVFAAPDHETAVAGLGALSLDLDLATLLTDGLGAAHVTGFGIHGDGVSAQIMDVYGVSNIVAEEEVRLFEAWIEQPIGPATLRAGLLSADTEYVIAEQSAELLDSTFGMIGQFSANNVGPVYPVATPGASARVELAPVVVRAAVYDGERENTHGIPTALAESVLGFGEVALWSTVKLGGWVHTDGPDGAYAVVDRAIEGRLGVFARGSVSDGPVDLYADAGVRGPPGTFRPRDVCTVGVAYARTDALGVREHHVVVEATYQLAIAGWLIVQPDAQVVVTPDRNVLVGAVRTRIAF